MLSREECKLRHIESEDLERILQWRNSDRVRHNMYSDHLISMQEHRAWFERSKQQTSSVHLVFEAQGRALGLVYFTDIDRKNDKSFWGFYLGEEDRPGGCGWAMGVLGLEYAFGRLELRKLCGEALAFNDSSIRFFERLGFTMEGRFVGHVLKQGSYEDVVSFALFKSDWLKKRDLLEAKAFRQGERH